MSSPPRVKTTALTHNEEYCTIAIFTPPTGYEPKLLDNFDYSETSAMIFQDESGDIDTEPSYSCDAELDDEIIGKPQSSPPFIQERGESADRRQAYHSYEESLLPRQSFFTHTRTGRPENEHSSSQKRKSSREMENERIRILLERQKEQILAEVRTEMQKHDFQAYSDRRDHRQSALFHHCSFRSEKNQRGIDKLIALLKKVCCQVSPCLSVMQERGDPYMNLVR